MTYQDWIQAVNAALKANQKGFSTSDIDPASLGQAFNAGMSPVVFARQAVPAPRPVYQPAPVTVPVPGAKLVTLTYWVLIVMGWLGYFAASWVILVWLDAVAGLGIAANSSKIEPPDRAALLLGSMATAGGSFGTAFAFSAAGAAWHCLAIILSKTYNKP